MTLRVLIVTGAPADAVDGILEAIAGAGGGEVGEYTHCAYTNEGFGRFKPGVKATPQVGAKETVNKVPEVRIETFCDRDKAKAIATAVRAAHPYEEVVVYLIPLLDEDDL